MQRKGKRKSRVNQLTTVLLRRGIPQFCFCIHFIDSDFGRSRKRFVVIDRRTALRDTGLHLDSSLNEGSKYRIVIVIKMSMLSIAII